MPQFSSTLTVNSLIWVTSLELNELGVTRRILEDLTQYSQQIGLRLNHFMPRTADQFLEILHKTAREADAGLRPILHLDAHGDLTQGIKLAASGEFVSWPDLVASLRAINVATRNNLCVISGACFSMNAIWQVTLSDPCPFFILIAPGNEVSSGFLEDKTLAFYKTAFEGLEIVAAHEKHLAPALALHHCERMLAYLLAGYIRDYCIGKGGHDRREQLLTKTVAAGLAHNRHGRRRIRQAAKEWTRPNQTMVERFTNDFASTFLIGKPLGFDITDVLMLVNSEVHYQRDAKRGILA